jgi:uncharacterized protein YwbE
MRLFAGVIEKGSVLEMLTKSEVHAIGVGAGPDKEGKVSRDYGVIQS